MVEQRREMGEKIRLIISVLNDRVFQYLIVHTCYTIIMLVSLRVHSLQFSVQGLGSLLGTPQVVSSSLRKVKKKNLCLIHL